MKNILLTGENKGSDNKEKLKDIFEKIYNDLIKEYLSIKVNLTSLIIVELQIAFGDVSVHPYTHKSFVERHFANYGEKIKEEIQKATDKINYWLFIYFDDYKVDDNVVEVGKSTYYHVLHEHYGDDYMVMDSIGSILKRNIFHRMATKRKWVKELAENIIDDTKNDFLPYFNEYIKSWKEQVESNFEKKYVNIIKNIERNFNII